MADPRLELTDPASTPEVLRAWALEAHSDEPTPEQVRAAREAAGLTQEQAGAITHNARRAWQDWEAGNRRMPHSAWTLYLLMTNQHPNYQLTPKSASSNRQPAPDVR